MAKVSKAGGPSYDPNQPEGSAEGLPPAGAVGGVVDEGVTEDTIGGSVDFEDTPEDENTEAPGYDEQTVEELKDELRARDLPVSGTKAELVDRLTEADNAPADDTGAAES